MLTVGGVLAAGILSAYGVAIAILAVIGQRSKPETIPAILVETPAGGD